MSRNSRMRIPLAFCAASFVALAGWDRGICRAQSANDDVAGEQVLTPRAGP